ncbi:hypothetical protein K8R78_02560 [bacterium]|nr:hypothetical protein [bacterium]
MESKHSIPPEQLEKALEDVKQIRNLVNQNRIGEVFSRIISNALPGFSILFFLSALTMAGIQLILDYGAVTIVGLAKNTFVWGVGLLATVILGIFKFMLFTRQSRRQGEDFWKIVVSFYRRGFMAVMVPWAAIILVGCFGFSAAGESWRIAGFLSVGMGGLFVSGYFQYVPLWNMTPSGLAAIVLGIPATFWLPEYPFYKLAVVFAAMGLLLLLPWRRKERG